MLRPYHVPPRLPGCLGRGGCRHLRPPLAAVARGRGVRRALVVGDGAARSRDGVRGLAAGGARRVRRGTGGAAAGGRPAPPVRPGGRPVRAEPPPRPATPAPGRGPPPG